MTRPDMQRLLASLPSVDELLKSERGTVWLRSYPRLFVLQGIREEIQRIRQAIIKERLAELPEKTLLADIEATILRLSALSLESVINATGIVIHTNLGRSILSEAVMENVRKIACAYSNLEYDLVEGARGKRYSHIRRLLNELTGADDSIVVNNNAAAVLVSLNAIAKAREVIVSRGELVEIGGSFRIPEVMASSGAILKEVGTTNKTHAFDYEHAVTDQTALLLKVHQSNYRMTGFTETVSLADLVKLGKQNNIPVMFDLGSGCLIDLKPYGIQIEPAVQEVVRAGVDIVTFSGDKLLGGPQIGAIVGKANLIEMISRNPLMRAVRVDKLTLSAFEATLMCYIDEGQAKQSVPTLRMLLQDPLEIRRRARKVSQGLRKRLAGDPGIVIEVLEDVSQAGGGSLPEVAFKTFVVTLSSQTVTVNTLENRLRRSKPPIIARIKDNKLVLDLRTVKDKEIDAVVTTVSRALAPL